MVTVTGLGSWPGVNSREALQTIRDLLADPAGEGLTGMPYLPELPTRGPGADSVGRSAHLLIDLPVDLQPQGWRLVDRPGLDATRTASLWRQDLDELAESLDGWQEAFKLQVTGPWTMASELWLPLGDRVLSDAGAIRDLTASVAAGVAEHVADVQRLLPAASLTVQIDEPNLSRVLLGQVPSASGYRRLPAPDPDGASAAMKMVLDAARAAGAGATALYCADRRPPLRVMRTAAPDGLCVDVVGLSPRAWEGLATALESGIALWVGALAEDSEPSAYRTGHDALVKRWREVGLPVARLAELGVTSTGGLSGSNPQRAIELTQATLRLGRDLAETAAS